MATTKPQKRFGVFTVNGIDKETYLTIDDNDIPVTFKNEEEAITWAEDNWPDFFYPNPNGWQSLGFEVMEIEEGGE